MVKIKEMPYSEKYAMVADNVKFDKSFLYPFVRRHLGDQTVNELKGIMQSGFKPVPEEASFEEKYEVAYGNWIWSVRNIFRFIRERMGEEGFHQFERADVEELIKKNASLGLLLLNLIRLFSTGTAFTMTCKKLGYKFQWLTPFSMSELTRDKAVLDVPRCKILDFADTDDICLVGCQRIYPMWMAEQFKLSMTWNRQGNSCTGILTPMT
ncbi:MAG: hypothetical protein JRF50_13065 [Deltaproteobacteria bacterium]|nr:hypothetical protein [Deltaproteobacteria bacterium]